MYLHQLKHSQKGFTLVELIVGMTIFAVGMTAILALLHSAIDTSISSRQEIVTSNLLREEIELIKNVRNTNLRSFAVWNTVRTGGVASSFLSGGVYTVENDYTHTGAIYDPALGTLDQSPVYIDDVTLSIMSAPDLETKFNTTRLYLDDHGRFTHIASGTGTNYASYLLISPLIIDNGGVPLKPERIDPTDPIKRYPEGYILDARVITKSRYGYREYDLKTLITDWKK